MATINKPQQKVVHRKGGAFLAMVLACSAFLLASCGVREVVYIEGESPTTQPLGGSMNEFPSAESLSLSTSEFLALTARYVREEVRYCFTDCKALQEPEVWIRRAGGGSIDNENIASMAIFLTTRPIYEIDDYCDGFYDTTDAEIASAVNETGQDGKAWVAASYAICDS